MRYSQIIRTYDTTPKPLQYIKVEAGDFITIKQAEDKSKEFDGCMFFEILVFRTSTKKCYALWSRTDELEITIPVSYRIFEDRVPYIFIEQNGELSQMKSVRLT